MKNEEIYKLLEERDKRLDVQMDSMNKTLRYGLKGVRQYVDAGVEGVQIELETRNNLDSQRNNKIEKLEDQTTFYRWTQRNYKRVVPAAIILLFLFVKGSERVDPVQVLKSKYGIELTK